MTNSDKMKRLKEENDSLKAQIGKLMEKVEHLSREVAARKDESNGGPRGEQVESDVEETVLSTGKKRSVEFVSNQYDDVLKALEQIRGHVKDISKRCEELSSAVSSMEDYSYRYNVKLVGVPIMSEDENAESIVSVCLRLFAALGVKDISCYDIDTAHRVPARRATNKPNAIFCKFTRRLAKDRVMSARKNVTKLLPTHLGFPEHISLKDLRPSQPTSEKPPN